MEALSGESSQAELCRRHNLSEQQLSKWKQQAIENFASLFGSKDKASAADASRIAHLEQLVGRLIALDIFREVVELTASKKREMVEKVHNASSYSIRQIKHSATTGIFSIISRSILKRDCNKLAATYPTYGYRRITKLLVAEGHTVGYKRVSRLMKEANLSVETVKRACQTTHSAPQPWQNRLKTLDICRCDQTYAPLCSLSSLA